MGKLLESIRQIVVIAVAVYAAAWAWQVTGSSSETGQHVALWWR